MASARRPMTRLLLSLVLPTLAGVASALMALAIATDAAACACCTNRAGRYVDAEPLGGSRLDMIGQMTFAE